MQLRAGRQGAANIPGVNRAADGPMDALPDVAETSPARGKN